MRVDGEPVRPGAGTPRRLSRASEPAKQSGTQLTDTIRASGQHERLHQQAGHKTAPDQRVRSSIRHLQCGSHPHRTASYRPNPAARTAVGASPKRPFVKFPATSAQVAIGPWPFISKRTLSFRPAAVAARSPSMRRSRRRLRLPGPTARTRSPHQISSAAVGSIHQIVLPNLVVRNLWNAPKSSSKCVMAKVTRRYKCHCDRVFCNRGMKPFRPKPSSDE